MAFACRLASHQGHVEAAAFVGSVYGWGQGVAVDYPRSMAAYKVASEGGNALCQWMVGRMYYSGLGVDVDYAQALPWIEKAAAQDQPEAVGQLGMMYCDGKGITPSFRRAREYYERAIELGSSRAVENMQGLTRDIQAVTSRRSIHTAPLSLMCDLMSFSLPRIPRTHRSPPSWISGWRSTARAART